MEFKESDLCYCTGPGQPPVHINDISGYTVHDEYSIVSNAKWPQLLEFTIFQRVQKRTGTCSVMDPG